MRYTRLWVALSLVMAGSFAVLGYYGVEIYRQAPPVRVVGDTIFATGILALGWFVLGLKTGWSITDEIETVSVRPTATAP